MPNKPVSGLSWYESPTFWFITFSIIVAIGLWWTASGEPGAALRDGNYSCSQGQTSLEGNNPAATVQGGEVVDVWSFDLNTGTETPLPWRDAKQKSSTQFTVTTVGVLSGNRGTFECTLRE